MIKALKSLVTWLEKRFPEKVIVTSSDYLKLEAQVKAIHEALGRLYAIEEFQKRFEKFEGVAFEERIKKIEAECTKFNVELGFAGRFQTQAQKQGMLSR